MGLKSNLLNLPLCRLLGQVREAVPVYASGGFTSYEPEKLKRKFDEWLEEGHQMFKMKIGRNHAEDIKRLKAARELIDERALFVDANGAYFPKEALAMAEVLSDFEVSWFEEPVTSDDLEGLHFVKNNAARLNIAAGEYGYSPTYFKRMLAAASVDVLQADATRCAGITGFLKAYHLSEAFHVPFSAHCAPALHLHPALSLENLQHIEYFRDHVKIEEMLFDGFRKAENALLKPDLERNGFGLEFKFQDAEKFKIN